MRFVFLNPTFYKDYDPNNFPEIEQKISRPYILVLITLKHLTFGLPFRSNINHPHAFLSDRKNKCGLDYSKAVVVSEKYIDTEKKPKIRPNEYARLVGKDAIITAQFEKYIHTYQAALTNPKNKYDSLLCQYSTLQYFHKELGILP